MGILDDIKNPELLSYKSFTAQDLIKDIKSMKFNKDNKPKEIKVIYPIWEKIMEITESNKKGLKK